MVRRKPVTDSAIGALVREKRHARGVSQDQLGAALGVTFGMIQKYETGASPLTVVKLVQIATYLECQTIDLIP